MTDNKTRIIPPPELQAQWRKEWSSVRPSVTTIDQWIATKSAQWGYAQRAARRPSPPSLKEQALQALANADGADHPVVATVLTADQHALIRKALEQLND